MATNYNFDEAYATDSFTDSDWESICKHVGIELSSQDEGNADENIKENEGNIGKKEENIEIDDTNIVAEPRHKMKDMRKILKRGRVQLLNPNENDLRETYKEF